MKNRVGDPPAWLAGLIQSSVEPLTHPRIVSVATDRVAAAEEWYCECARVQLGGRLRKNRRSVFRRTGSSPRGHEILREPRRERARVVRARVERIHRGPVAAAVLDHEARQAGQGSRETILFAETMQPIALTASASCSSRDGNNLQKNLRRPTRADAATTGIATARSDAGARRADGPALHQPPSLKQRSARLKRPR